MDIAAIFAQLVDDIALEGRAGISGKKLKKLMVKNNARGEEIGKDLVLQTKLVEMLLESGPEVVSFPDLDKPGTEFHTLVASGDKSRLHEFFGMNGAMVVASETARMKALNVPPHYHLTQTILDILEIIGKNREKGCFITDIQKKVGIDLGTVHLNVTSLCVMNLVKKGFESQGFSQHGRMVKLFRYSVQKVQDKEMFICNMVCKILLDCPQYLCTLPNLRKRISEKFTNSSKRHRVLGVLASLTSTYPFLKHVKLTGVDDDQEHFAMKLDYDEYMAFQAANKSKEKTGEDEPSENESGEEAEDEYDYQNLNGVGLDVMFDIAACDELSTYQKYYLMIDSAPKGLVKTTLNVVQPGADLKVVGKILSNMEKSKYIYTVQIGLNKVKTSRLFTPARYKQYLISKGSKIPEELSNPNLFHHVAFMTKPFEHDTPMLEDLEPAEAQLQLTKSIESLANFDRMTSRAKWRVEAIKGIITKERIIALSDLAKELHKLETEEQKIHPEEILTLSKAHNVKVIRPLIEALRTANKIKIAIAHLMLESGSEKDIEVAAMPDVDIPGDEFEDYCNEKKCEIADQYMQRKSIQSQRISERRMRQDKIETIVVDQDEFDQMTQETAVVKTKALNKYFVKAWMIRVRILHMHLWSFAFTSPDTQKVKNENGEIGSIIFQINEALSTLSCLSVARILAWSDMFTPYIDSLNTTRLCDIPEFRYREFFSDKMLNRINKLLYKLSQMGLVTVRNDVSGSFTLNCNVVLEDVTVSGDRVIYNLDTTESVLNYWSELEYLCRWSIKYAPVGMFVSDAVSVAPSRVHLPIAGMPDILKAEVWLHKQTELTKLQRSSLLNFQQSYASDHMPVLSEARVMAKSIGIDIATLFGAWDHSLKKVEWASKKRKSMASVKIPHHAEAFVKTRKMSESGAISMEFSGEAVPLPPSDPNAAPIQDVRDEELIPGMGKAPVAKPLRVRFSPDNDREIIKEFINVSSSSPEATQEQIIKQTSETMSVRLGKNMSSVEKRLKSLLKKQSTNGLVETVLKKRSAALADVPIDPNDAIFRIPKDPKEFFAANTTELVNTPSFWGFQNKLLRKKGNPLAVYTDNRKGLAPVLTAVMIVSMQAKKTYDAKYATRLLANHKLNDVLEAQAILMKNNLIKRNRGDGSGRSSICSGTFWTNLVEMFFPKTIFAESEEFKRSLTSGTGSVQISSLPDSGVIWTVLNAVYSDQLSIVPSSTDRMDDLMNSVMKKRRKYMMYGQGGDTVMKTRSRHNFLRVRADLASMNSDNQPVEVSLVKESLADVFSDIAEMIRPVDEEMTEIPARREPVVGQGAANYERSLEFMKSEFAPIIDVYKRIYELFSSTHTSLTRDEVVKSLGLAGSVEVVDDCLNYLECFEVIHCVKEVATESFIFRDFVQPYLLTSNLEGFPTTDAPNAAVVDAEGTTYATVIPARIESSTEDENRSDNGCFMYSPTEVFYNPLGNLNRGLLLCVMDKILLMITKYPGITEQRIIENMPFTPCITRAVIALLERDMKISHICVRKTTPVVTMFSDPSMGLGSEDYEHTIKCYSLQEPFIDMTSPFLYSDPELIASLNVSSAEKDLKVD